MKKRVIVLTGLVVFIGLVVLVLSQMSGTKAVQAADASCCSGVEMQMYADKGASTCGSQSVAKVASECPGIQDLARDAGCPAFSSETVGLSVASANNPESCCEGSESAAMLAEACCGKCS